jgi:hypothetical protein
MSVVLDRSEIEAKNAHSIISFETKGGGQWKIWDRYLFLEGRPAYHIGNICDTCAFFFEREEGANQKVSPGKVSNALRKGVRSLERELLEDVASILPNARYEVALLEFVPELITPGAPEDYFRREQIELWGIDAFWGLPHNPQTEYYRIGSQFLGEDIPLGKKLLPPNVRRSHLFEFCVPIYPGSWLNKDTVESYRNKLLGGEGSTAIALSVLDVKQPANWYDDSKINEHWCLAHYLLDGHHKTYAAASVHKSITLLSFMDVSKGISRKEDVEFLFNALSR